MTHYDYLFKIALRGDKGVGKSNLLSRYSSDEFKEEYRSTNEASFASAEIKIDGKLIRSQIWDTHGAEQDDVFTSGWYHSAAGVVLVYDITNAASFASIPGWLREARDNSDSNVVIELVGNKADSTDMRKVSTEEAAKFAIENKLLFVETSALTTENVKAVFNNLLAEIYKGFSAKA